MNNSHCSCTVTNLKSAILVTQVFLLEQCMVHTVFAGLLQSPCHPYVSCLQVIGWTVCMYDINFVLHSSSLLLFWTVMNMSCIFCAVVIWSCYTCSWYAGYPSREECNENGSHIYDTSFYSFPALPLYVMTCINHYCLHYARTIFATCFQWLPTTMKMIARTS